jgi:hypothetical protein
MNEATNNSAIEDGSAGASPLGSSSSQPAASDSPAGNPDSAISERAPGESQKSEVDPLGAIYDELAGEGEGQTNPTASASPSNVENTTPAATEQAKADAARRTRDYEGLEPDGRALLKSVNLLLEPKDWNAMSEGARANLIETAKSHRAEKERLFQESRRQDPQQIPQSQTHGALPPATPNTQTNPQAKAPPAEIETLIGQVHAAFGEDLSTPLRQITAHQQAVYEQREQQLIGHIKEALAGRDERINFLIERLEKSEKAKAYEILDKDLKVIPEYSAKEKREEIEKNARALLRAQRTSGNRDFTLEQAMVQAARVLFYPQLQQQEQTKLATARTNSLRGTFERPAAVVAQPSANRTKSESDEMDAVYDELATTRS